MEQQRKATISFSADEALMFLIQQTTKLPTEDILGFFYDLGIKVAEIGIDKMKGRGIRKDIRDVFPGSYIPFKLLVKARRSGVRPRPPATGIEFWGSIEVTFPDKSRVVDQQALVEKIVEKNLLDGDSLPNFPQPKNKTPKMYKELIEQAIKGTKTT